MINIYEVLETNKMIEQENLDVRTITMGINLLDCVDSDVDALCRKIYDKITRLAKDLVKTGEDISKEYGIPIVNKRVSITPVSLVGGSACRTPEDYVKVAHALDRAAKEVGINFLGGYSAVVSKGMTHSDELLIRSIPQALAETERICSSVNVGSTKTGINMDAVRLMGEILYVLCGGSVHTHQAELAQGYLTTASGCRVGVGGRFVLRGPEDVVLQRLSSLNFRIARPICTELPAELCTLLQGHFIGALLVGEPDSGKTTLLRQIARELAAQKRAVAVIDERGELFPPEQQNGDALDCISGLPKGRAVQMALRTLAPQVILLDELGDLTEVTALEQGFFSGVEFVASVHAATLEDALQRPQVRVLQQQGALRFLVLLEGRCAPGRIREIRQLPLL